MLLVHPVPDLDLDQIICSVRPLQRKWRVLRTPSSLCPPWPHARPLWGQPGQSGWLIVYGSSACKHSKLIRFAQDVHAMKSPRPAAVPMRMQAIYDAVLENHRPWAAPGGSGDPWSHVVAVARHDRPAKPCSGRLEWLRSPSLCRSVASIPHGGPTRSRFTVLLPLRQTRPTQATASPS
jgi:hypothetical protein